MTDRKELNAHAEIYRVAVKNLLEMKSKMFPHHTTVNVQCERYHGTGVVVGLSECPPDRVAVSLQNENVWFYPVEAVTPVANVI